MLFYIDGSIHSYLCTHDSLKNIHKENLERAFYAWSQGYCWIAGDPDSLKDLSLLFQQANIRAIRDAFTQLRSFTDIVEKVFVLTVNERLDEQQMPDYVFEKAVPIHLDKEYRFEQTALLTEDIRDYDFYRFVYRFYAADRKANNIPFMLGKHHGGGIRICDVLYLDEQIGRIQHRLSAVILERSNICSRIFGLQLTIF